MLNTFIFYTHYTLILLFGLLLSVAFAGIRFSKKNIGIILILFTLCGSMQLAGYAAFDEMFVWKIYPLITHLPIFLLLYLYYHKPIPTALAAVSTAYLYCQPAKWFGLLLETLTGSHVLGQTIRILTLLIVCFIAVRYLTSYMSEIYSKDNRSVIIFGIVPVIYYVFDYSMGIYTDFWLNNNRTTTEFLSFFLCIVHMIFCLIYYKEHEQKTDAERKEQIIRITVQQQSKEIEAVKRSEHEIKLFRHDMRLLLNNLALSIEQGDKENSLKMISGFVSQVEATSLKRYCVNDTLNYILSNFEAKCLELQIAFIVTVEIESLDTDEIIFSSILSNALDNALNAQKDLPVAERKIKLMMKTSNDKLLLSIKNPFDKTPVFVDGLPISTQKGHGYGTQSIRYMTERLGGNYQFAIQDNYFILRIVL